MRIRAQIQRVVNTGTGTAHACRSRDTGLTPRRHRNTGIVRAVTCLPAQVIEDLGEGVGEQHVREEHNGPDKGAHEEEDADGQAHGLALDLNLSKLGVGRQLVRVLILYQGASTSPTLHGRSESTAHTFAQHCSHSVLPAVARRRRRPPAPRPGCRAGPPSTQSHGAGVGIGCALANADALHAATPAPPRCATCECMRRTGQATPPPAQRRPCRNSRAPRAAGA